MLQKYNYFMNFCVLFAKMFLSLVRSGLEWISDCEMITKRFAETGHVVIA